MKLKEITGYLDTVIPLSFQEEYDNSGLQTGEAEAEISSALITLDVTGRVIDEAVNEGCNLIISHHPVIFRGIKRLTGASLAEKIVLTAVRNNIAVYSAHTNLDALSNGVSAKMAEKLDLKNVRILSPLKSRLLKLVTFIPSEHFDRVSCALFDAGAGVTGNYDRCGYSVSGTGSFRAGKDSNPFTGEKEKQHFEPEVRFETIFWSHNKANVIKALLSAHPYEEVAYDIYRLENENVNAGFGCVGELDTPLPVEAFLRLIADTFSAPGIRYSCYSGNVRRVALCGGAGSALVEDAVACGADAFVTGDLKYHQFQDADKRLLLVDCGHYETEIFSREILSELINKKFPTFAVRFSKTNTNPINYL